MPDFFSRINISEDLSLFLTILAVDFSGAAIESFPGLHISEWIFFGLMFDCFHTRNLFEDFGRVFFLDFQRNKHAEWAKHLNTWIGLVFYTTSGAGILRPPATYLNISTVHLFILFKQIFAK